jgi:hypothetical protein
MDEYVGEMLDHLVSPLNRLVSENTDRGALGTTWTDAFASCELEMDPTPSS